MVRQLQLNYDDLEDKYVNYKITIELVNDFKGCLLPKLQCTN